MMGGDRGHREALELRPFALGGVALLVAERELDEAAVLERVVDLARGSVEQLGDPRRGDGQALLQIKQPLDGGGLRRSFHRAEMFQVGLQGLAHSPSERIEHDTAAERAPAGLVADYEAVARQRDHWLGEHSLYRRALVCGE